MWSIRSINHDLKTPGQWKVSSFFDSKCQKFSKMFQLSATFIIDAKLSISDVWGRRAGSNFEHCNGRTCSKSTQWRIKENIQWSCYCQLWTINFQLESLFISTPWKILETYDDIHQIMTINLVVTIIIYFISFTKLINDNNYDNCKTTKSAELLIYKERYCLKSPGNLGT